MTDDSKILMAKKLAYWTNFQECTKELRHEFDAFTCGTATLEEYTQRGQGNLEEGIRTTMRLGDLEIWGRAEDAPDEETVEEDYNHFDATFMQDATWPRWLRCCQHSL